MTTASAPADPGARLDLIEARLRNIERHMLTHKDLLVAAGVIVGINLAVVGAASAAVYFAMANLMASMATLQALVLKAIP